MRVSTFDNNFSSSLESFKKNPVIPTGGLLISKSGEILKVFSFKGIGEWILQKIFPNRRAAVCNSLSYFASEFSENDLLKKSAFETALIAYKNIGFHDKERKDSLINTYQCLAKRKVIHIQNREESDSQTASIANIAQNSIQTPSDATQDSSAGYCLSANFLLLKPTPLEAPQRIEGYTDDEMFNELLNLAKEPGVANRRTIFDGQLNKDVKYSCGIEHLISFTKTLRDDEDLHYKFEILKTHLHQITKYLRTASPEERKNILSILNDGGYECIDRHVEDSIKLYRKHVLKVSDATETALAIIQELKIDILTTYLAKNNEIQQPHALNYFRYYFHTPLGLSIEQAERDPIIASKKLIYDIRYPISEVKAYLLDYLTLDAIIDRVLSTINTYEKAHPILESFGIDTSNYEQYFDVDDDTYEYTPNKNFAILLLERAGIISPVLTPKTQPHEPIN